MSDFKLSEVSDNNILTIQNEDELMRFDVSGDIYIRGEKVTNNKDVVEGMMDILKGYKGNVRLFERVDGVVIGGIYKHFKGGIYRVLNVAMDSGNPKVKVVVYESLEDRKIWVRKIEEFLDENLDKDIRYRFEYIGNSIK